jgi:hypothetical protein
MSFILIQIVMHSGTKLDSPRVIHLQQFSGCPTFRGATDDSGVLLTKVISPIVAPRIEKPNQFIRQRVVCAQVRALESIAPTASPT